MVTDSSPRRHGVHRVELVLSFQCCLPYWVRSFSVLHLRALGVSVVIKWLQIVHHGDTEGTENSYSASISFKSGGMSAVSLCLKFISSPARTMMLFCFPHLSSYFG